MTEAPNTEQDIEEAIAEAMGDDETELQVNTETGEIIEPDAEPEPQGLSQADIEKRMAQLEKEAARHEKRVAEIMADDFALLVPSPVDWTPGYIFGVPEMLPSGEQIAALFALLGEAPPTEYPDDPGREACDVCEGSGKLRTHSRVPNEESLPCRFCQGHGWVGEGNPKIQPIQIAPVTPIHAQTFEPNQPIAAADRWGRPFGHPHYGLEPAQVGA